MNTIVTRLAVFTVVLSASLSLVFLLPKTPEMKEAAYTTEMPVAVGSGWNRGLKQNPSDKELSILSRETGIFRYNYYRHVPDDEAPQGVYSLEDVLTAGLVQSGSDPANSIHAPERCLPAQGFEIDAGATGTVFVDLPGGIRLPVRRLPFSRFYEIPGHPGITVHGIQFYFFVGHDYVTANHFRRGVRDFTDRLFKGYDQRWGYFTVTAHLDHPPERPKEEGDKPMRQLTPARAEALALEFIRDFAQDMLKMDQIKAWARD